MTYAKDFNHTTFSPPPAPHFMFKYKTHYKHRQKVTNSLCVNFPSKLSLNGAHLLAASSGVDRRS